MITVPPRVGDTERLNVSDVARILDVHRSSVHRWINEGKLKSRRSRINKRQVITGKEVKRFFESDY